ncbi:MAG: hypothetical protein IPO45_11835 [Saprospiraceae bacterium]|nr:hypothetical protein [Candidatus Brachybacter algidus]
MIKKLFFIYPLTMLLFVACNSKMKSNDNAALVSNPIVTSNDQTKPNLTNMPNPVPESDFREVDSLININQIKSAEALLSRMAENYEKNGRWDGYVRAVMSLTTIKARNEDGQQDAINYLEAQIKSASFPAKSILYSVAAKTYKSYLDQNRYNLRDVTDGEGLSDDNDFQTWSMEKLLAKIEDYYFKSIENEDLKSIPVGNINLITYEGNTDYLKPTLFDFLTYDLLLYLQNDQYYVDEPVYKFEISGNEWNDDYQDFMKRNLTAKDTLSRVFKSLVVYQRLLQHQSNIENEAGLHSIDLDRLNFVYTHSIDPNKDQQFIEALDKIIKKGGKADWKANYILRKIELSQQTDKYSVENPEIGNRNLLNEVITQLEELIQDYPNTPAAKRARNKINAINTPSLTIQSEGVHVPNKPFLMLGTYSNLTNTDVFVYKLTKAEFVSLTSNRYNEENKRMLAQKPIFKTLNVNFPDFKDHRQHKVEFKVEGLYNGFYLMSHVMLNSIENYYYNYATLQITNLALISSYSNRAKDQVNVVVDRTTGAPIEKVIANVYTINYGRRENASKIATYESDKNGFIKYNLKEGQNYFSTFEKGKDELVDQNTSYSYYNNNTEQNGPRANFFTDRAIYRPGQILYFKAIMYTLDAAQMPFISKSKKVVVSLKDANDQQVASTTLTTNEYGSLNGNFTLPMGVLTGGMTLYFDGQYGKSIQVEEYKRPKFEVKMDTITKPYQLKDKVTFAGKALNYAGNALDGANLTYTITRQQQWMFPSWGRGYYKMYMPSNEMIIANGNLVTDDNGAFKVEFEAIPDASVPQKNKPRFTYSISIDVTDINGETQSGSQSLTLGYDKYFTEFSATGNVDKSKLQSLVVDTKNSAGISVPVNGRLKIELLVSNTNYLRPKLYAVPEQATISRSEYKSLWPYEPYLDEMDQSKWAVQQVVFDKKIKSGSSPVEGLKNIDFSKGDYRITFDIEGQDIVEAKEANYVHVNAPNGVLDFQVDKQMHVSNDKTTYQPSESARLSMASRNPSGKILYEFFVKGILVNREWLTTSTAASKSIKIEESYRGGVNVIATVFGNNRVESQSTRLNVPWSNKDLNITLKTFRDKLEPGSEESWELMISGPNKDKVMAEVLASMYDASLDVFAQDSYDRIGFPTVFADYVYADKHNQVTNIAKTYSALYESEDAQSWRQYRSELLVQWYYNRRMYKSSAGGRMPSPTMRSEESMQMNEMSVEAVKSVPGQAEKKVSNDTANVLDSSVETKDNKAEELAPPPSVRTNLDETVFFYPNLYTDAQGNVIVKFKMKEALTRWKMRVFAHTQDLKQGAIEQEVTTSKDLMVFPNLPRYFRENDELELTAKVTNMNGMSGIANAKLELINAITMQALPAELFISPAQQSFSIAAGKASVVSWKIKSPSLPTEAVVVRITANTEAHSDGEENTLPVLSNRMMVTETMPMMIRKQQEKTFTFESMLSANKSTTISPYKYTVEYSSNPVWYAVQALPYLMEYPHECTEQILNRYYANTLAAHVANSNPMIKAVFERWKNSDALLSNLQKNQELKSALLEETPWVLDAQSEEMQKKNIGLLFDLNRMSNEQASALRKIIERQSYNGGLPWFPGCKENEYVTSYVIENIGHLMHLGVLKDNDGQVAEFVRKASTYCDNALTTHYNELKKWNKNDPAEMAKDHLDYWAIQYLYARSFIKNADAGYIKSEAYQYYFNQSKKYWNTKNQYAEGMMALYLSRGGDKVTPNLIVEGLRQTAYRNEKLGMYWNSNSGYFWYELPIESQALMIEVFAELTKDQESIDEMKMWLLLNKQTVNWKTTKSTSAAIYALLLNGGIMTLETVYPNMEIGGKKLDIQALRPEEGTGYFKTSYDGKDIKPEMATIKVKNNSQVVNWGGAYYQYFEQMDKIQTFKATPLTIEKSYNIVSKGDRGETISPVSVNNIVKVGDKIRVRTVIKVDRPMEFVHLKDMRPAGTEPINTVSGYRYKNGLGYYESTKDIATHFFIDYLPKGTYVFEYDIRASLKGDYSTGISTMQCMYAPEFSSHSKGERMVIK